MIDPRRVSAAPDAPFYNYAGLGIGSRVHIGLGAYHNNSTDGSVTGGSWLQGFDANGVTVTEWDYFEDMGQLSVVTQHGIAVSGVARTIQNAAAFGGVFAVLNDGAGKKAWAWYADAVKSNAGADNTALAELNITNMPGPSPRGGATPYNPYTFGQVGGLAVAAGSDASLFGRSYAVDFAMEFRNNGGAFAAGLVFRHNALMRELTPDDTTLPSVGQGFAKAVVLGFEQGISFYSRNPIAEEGTQAEVARIYSSITDPALRFRVQFTDTGLAVGDYLAPARNAFVVAMSNTTESGIQVTAGEAGASPGINAIGPGVKYDLKLTPKGAGSVVLNLASVLEAANDTAAAAAGVSIGGVYRTANALKIRIS